MPAFIISWAHLASCSDLSTLSCISYIFRWCSNCCRCHYCSCSFSACSRCLASSISARERLLFALAFIKLLLIPLETIDNRKSQYFQIGHFMLLTADGRRSLKDIRNLRVHFDVHALLMFDLVVACIDLCLYKVRKGLANYGKYDIGDIAARQL